MTSSEFDSGSPGPSSADGGRSVVPMRASARVETPPPVGDEVVEGTKRGETWAWEEAYRAYARGLTGFLVLRLGSRDEAAEALSETFLRALSRADSFRGNADAFRAWMFRIARNVASDRLRARKRVTFSDHEAGDPVDLLVSDPDSGLIAREDAAQVRRALAGLDPEDREVLWLRICARLSSAEVGDIVGKKPGAVRMQQQRALAALAQRMGLT